MIKGVYEIVWLIFALLYDRACSMTNPSIVYIGASLLLLSLFPSFCISDVRFNVSLRVHDKINLKQTLYKTILKAQSTVRSFILNTFVRFLFKNKLNLHILAFLR